MNTKNTGLLLDDEIEIVWRHGFKSARARRGLPFVREELWGVHLGPVPKWRQTGLILGYSVLKRGGKKLRRVFYVEEYDGIANAGRPVCEGVDPLFIVPGTFGAKTPRSYKPMRPATQRNLYKIFQARRDQEEARRANSRKKYNS